MSESRGFRYRPSMEEYLEHFGYTGIEDIPKAEVLIPSSPNCHKNCQLDVGRVREVFANYLSFTPIGSDYTLSYFPMMIDLAEHPDWSSFEAYLKGFGKGQRPRMAKKAERNGFYVKPFSWSLFLPDIYEINTSKEVRSGGKMSASYRRTLEEMGGPPTVYSEPVRPSCPLIWCQEYGVFRPEPGHRQGELVVDERLVGYISVTRYGNFAIYGTLLGHGDYLAEGVMVLLHLKIARWLIEGGSDPVAAGVRYLFYGGMQSGGAGLFQWKRLAGFRPYRVECRFVDCPQPQG